jgi:hypothetical protein
MVAALHSYTHPTWLRFWGSGSLIWSRVIACGIIYHIVCDLVHALLPSSCGCCLLRWHCCLAVLASSPSLHCVATLVVLAPLPSSCCISVIHSVVYHVVCSIVQVLLPSSRWNHHLCWNHCPCCTGTVPLIVLALLPSSHWRRCYCCDVAVAIVTLASLLSLLWPLCHS